MVSAANQQKAVRSPVTQLCVPKRKFRVATGSVVLLLCAIVLDWLLMTGVLWERTNALKTPKPV